LYINLYTQGLFLAKRQKNSLED